MCECVCACVCSVLRSREGLGNVERKRDSNKRSRGSGMWRFTRMKWRCRGRRGEIECGDNNT